MKRQTFSTEFKCEAVRLLEQGSQEVSQLARELGVKRNQLYKWQNEIQAHAANAFPGHGRRPKLVDETHSLCYISRFAPFPLNFYVKSLMSVGNDTFLINIKWS